MTTKSFEDDGAIFEFLLKSGLNAPCGNRFGLGRSTSFKKQGVLEKKQTRSNRLKVADYG